MYQIQKQKGITLIALIITIIILLILAGVTLYFIVGENGVLKKAEYARQEYTNAQNEEKEILDNYNNLMNSYTSNEKVLSAEMFYFTPEDTNWNVKNVKEALDYFYNK